MTQYRFLVEPPLNGQPDKGTVIVLDPEGVPFYIVGRVEDPAFREGAARRLADELGADPEVLALEIETQWIRAGGAPGEASVAGLTLTRLDTIQPEPVRWQVDGRIPLGKLTLIAGD